MYTILLMQTTFFSSQKKRNKNKNKKELNIFQLQNKDPIKKE